MAKAKKSSGKSGPKKSRHSSSQQSKQIRFLFAVIVFLFLLASVFDLAGVAGHSLFTFYRHLFGMATPLIAVFMVWRAIRYKWKDLLPMTWESGGGWVLFVISLTGILHGIGGGDPLLLAQEGAGGGQLGYLVYNTLTTGTGPFIGRVIIYVLACVGLMLILDQSIPGLFAHEAAEGEEEDAEEEEESAASKVKVMGEIKATPLLNRFKKNVKVDDKATAPAPKKLTVDTLHHVSRSLNWNYPELSLLESMDMKPQAGNIQKRMDQIQKTLSDFGIEVTMEAVNIGPTVTQYTLKPADGVKLNQITARQDDLALALAAQSLRVEAPIPGKGLVGIEIPNDKKAIVGLKDILTSKQFKHTPSKLALALGRDAAGDPSVADLAKMPHLLIAGSTGSGKSVCINTIILALLMNNSPDELRMILVDPKRVELNGYNGLPHLLTPVITEPKDTVAALTWAVKEMERRYKLCANTGNRNIEQYNQNPDLAEGKLPYIVIIVDELADLMMVAAREVEGAIVRLAQMARAVGMHLIVATQRPSVDVITGLIKANVPTRIAFAVASQIDSRTIIDMAGAEKLLGYGDMLYVSNEVGKPKRIQGVYCSEKEITAVVAHIRQQEEGDRYDPSVLETRTESRLGGSRGGGDEIDDDLFDEAYEVVKQAGKASTTLLQTRLAVGYARAARLMQALEDKGLIGPAKGAKPREVYGISASEEETDSLDTLEDIE